VGGISRIRCERSDCPSGPRLPRSPAAARSTLWKAGITCGKGLNDAFVAPLILAIPESKKDALGLAGEERAMSSIDWRSTILRWGAVAFSLGAWIAIALGVRQLLG